MEPLKPFYLDLTEEEITAIQEELGRILRSGQLILGENTTAFEKEFTAHVGARHAVAMNTATSALEVLCVLNGARGKKVAVPSNTNFASVEAIIRAGGRPVFMDMRAETFQSDLKILKGTVERHGVEGVLWVHIGGIISPDFQEVAEYCRKQGLFLIEDCAHAHGSRLHGRHAGTFGDGGAFSFFPTKVMTTMEGGMLVTDNDEHAMLARSIRNQGKRGAAYGGLHHDHGNSWRMSEISAFMGRVQLARLDAMIARRQRAADIIAAQLDEMGIPYCKTSHMDQASQYKFIIRLPEDRHFEDVKKALAEYGIICGGGVYEVPCHQQPVFADIPRDPSELIETETWCPRHVCPPITSGTSVEDAERIAEALRNVLGEASTRA